MATIEHSTLTGTELHVTKDHQSEHVTGGDQIATFASGTRGLVPVSGGGTTNFLRADATFAAPSGGGSSTWISLTDTTPTSYTGQAGKYVKVNSGESGLEFGTSSGGVTDHGALTGLTDSDDHTQYLLVNGSRAMYGTLMMGDYYITGITQLSPSGTTITVDGILDINSHRITSVADPSANQDAATKKYVDDTTGSWEVSGTELQMGTARGMGMQGEDILYTGDVVPQTNNLSNLGTASYLWANVFATNGIFGDLGFEEKECHVCKEKFKVGDVIDLIIKSIESHGIMTVPVHKECNR